MDFCWVWGSYPKPTFSSKAFVKNRVLTVGLLSRGTFSNGGLCLVFILRTALSIQAKFKNFITFTMSSVITVNTLHDDVLQLWQCSYKKKGHPALCLKARPDLKKSFKA